MMVQDRGGRVRAPAGDWAPAGPDGAEVTAADLAAVSAVDTDEDPGASALGEVPGEAGVLAATALSGRALPLLGLLPRMKPRP
jgi:hypothetical protein